MTEEELKTAIKELDWEELMHIWKERLQSFIESEGKSLLVHG